ncbi:MAG TPA: tetratricopeptide repeat protein [Chloroflexi bacterium]|nr:tetratricopeptide repeat protein [Chloroflexota bacterium]
MQVNAADLPNLRRALSFVLLALLAISLSFVLGTTHTPYADLVRQGDALAERTYRTAAIAAYREAAQLRPDDPLPHIQQARVYLDWGRPGAALDALTEAKRREADVVTLAQLRLRAHVAREDWPAVVEQAQALRRQTPQDRDVQHALANAYVQMRDWDAARRAYEALLQADPTEPIAHERLGALLAGQDAIAIQHLYTAQTELARQLLDTLQAEDTVGDPAYTSALLGRTLMAAEQWALAVRHLARAVEIAPHYADAHVYLGHALDQMALPKEAYPHLIRGVALAPDSVPARTLLGLHYDRQGDYAAARTEYEAAYDLDPQSAALCVEIGQTWIAERRYNVAEIWFREALDLRPNDPVYWEILTRFYLEHELTIEERAIEAAETLLALAPESALAHDLRGWAAFQVGDDAAAAEFLQRALALNPYLASAHYHQGLLYHAQGARENARAAFTRALDLDTSSNLTPRVQRSLDELDRL